jgi:Phospholipase_D-nuclease N-terminal
MAKKQRWSELSFERRVAIVVGAVVELVLTSIALRDLAKRPSREVRGPKVLWFLGCFVQPIGPILYLRAGRRRS